ncbi:hypothetical protein DM01DRAFT_1166737 [Hesseltinella vesiculosa]|uniref:Uncharacterized protein n=1 Tax=Hesseltinella vesiculosa TaxID=101127 RepID=A0A1X2G5U4_9FUNG|nr:hypothetical protein DM01DRAFT_1166737 [Hesseltinella vesiculosa]
MSSWTRSCLIKFLKINAVVIKNHVHLSHQLDKLIFVDPQELAKDDDLSPYLANYSAHMMSNGTRRAYLVMMKAYVDAGRTEEASTFHKNILQYVDKNLFCLPAMSPCRLMKVAGFVLVPPILQLKKMKNQPFSPWDPPAHLIKNHSARLL